MAGVGGQEVEQWWGVAIRRWRVGSSSSRAFVEILVLL